MINSPCFRRIFFSLLSICALGAGIWFSFFHVGEPNPAMTSIWLTSSLFLLVLGWPEIIESVSFLGNNIKLREMKAAVNELRQLAETNAYALLQIYQGADRMGGFTDDDQLNIYQKIEAMLNIVGFEKEEIKKIQYSWHVWIESDYVREIIGIRSTIHPAIPEEKKDIWFQKRKELINKVNSITPEELRTIFQKMSAYNAQIETAINDFEYYKIHKEHRDFNKWKQRREWFSHKLLT